MADENIPPPPSGSIVDSAPAGAGAIPPPPSGSIVDSQPSSTENGQEQTPPAEAQDPRAGIGKGVLQGLGQTVGTVSGLLNKIPGIGETLAPKQGVDALESMSTPKTTPEKVGVGAEGLLEFMAGDEALKGLTLAKRLGMATKLAEMAESHPFLSKLIQAGLSSLRYGTTSAGQTLLHGGTPTEALESGAATAATSGVLGGIGEAGSAIKEGLGKNAGEEAGALAKSLSGGTEVAEQPEIVKGVQGALDKTEDAMHAKYDAGMKSISAAAKPVQVTVEGSPLQKVAKDLLGPNGVPEEINDALKGVVPDKQKIQPLLQEFAKDTQAGGKPDLSPTGGPMGTPKPPKAYSWDEMEAIRQKIGQAVRDVPFDSPIKGDLIRLRSGIDETMQQAAQKSGKPEVASQIKALRGEYANTINDLQNNGIKALRDKNPDAVAKILLGKQNSVERAETLRGLIGKENMKPVEGGVFQNLMDQSIDPKTQELSPKTLAAKYGKIAPEVKKAIWGDRVPEIDRFIKASQNTVSQRLGAAATAAGMGYGAWKIYSSPTKEGMPSLGTLEGIGIMVGAAGGGALHLPVKALSNPDIIRPLTKVMEAAGNPALRKGAAAAMSQLMRAAHPEGEPAESSPDSGSP